MHERAWTLLVYMCGDNNLESSAVAHLRELTRIGSTNDVAVVVQFDRKNAWRSMDTPAYLDITGHRERSSSSIGIVRQLRDRRKGVAKEISKLY